MKATLFKEVGYSISKLIQDIDMGEIGFPDIQRPFVWTPAKVRDLFDSMYKGFPLVISSSGGAQVFKDGVERTGQGRHRGTAPTMPHAGRDCDC